MNNKIINPVVLIHKREDSDTYAVAITSSSQDYHDGILMATMEPDMTGYADVWSKTGYYMAAEIEELRNSLKKSEEKYLHMMGVADDFDWQRQRLHASAEKVIGWCRQEAKDRNGNADAAENDSCVRELRAALEFCEKCEGANSIPLNGVTTGNVKAGRAGMTETNVFALAQIIKAAGSYPGDVTSAVWDAGYRKPERSPEEAVALTLDILSGFEGNDLPWSTWPKSYEEILQSELNEIVDEGLWHNSSNAVNVAQALIEAGFSKEVK